MFFWLSLSRAVCQSTQYSLHVSGWTYKHTRWDEQLQVLYQVPEFPLGSVVLAVFWDIKWITALLLNFYCRVLSAPSCWLHVISHMSQSQLQRTPSSVCQQKIVWDEFTKIRFVLAFLPFRHVCRESIRCWVSQPTACVPPDTQPGGGRQRPLFELATRRAAALWFR